MTTHNLTELIYDDDLRGSLRLYVMDINGMHRGGQWFANKVRYPGEEIPTESAKILAEDALKAGREVRITNGSDFLVFHAVDGRMIYPKHCVAERFWKAVMETSDDH